MMPKATEPDPLTGRTAAVLPFQRRVICEGCGMPYISGEPGPHCCQRCSDEVYAAEMHKWEAEARAAGFASLDERIEYEQRRAEESL